MFIGTLLEELRALSMVNTGLSDKLYLFSEAGEETVLPLATAVALTTHVNSALRNIYTRFPLKEKELYLQCVVGINKYFFTLEQTELGTKDKYILDDTYQNIVGTFVEDVYKVLEVRRAVSGTMVPLNIEGSPVSVFSHNSATLQVPSHMSDQKVLLLIRYLATPSSGIAIEGALPTTTLVAPGDPTLTKLRQSRPWKGFSAGTNLWSHSNSYIPVPEQFSKAIAAYICYKLLYKADTLLENTDATFYQSIYENTCREIKHAGLFNSFDSPSDKTTRITDAGW